MPEISLRFAWDMPEIWLRYVWDMTEICLRYDCDMPEICQRDKSNEISAIYVIFYKIFISCDSLSEWVSDRPDSRDASASKKNSYTKGTCILKWWFIVASLSWICKYEYPSWIEDMQYL